jgi:hypothetical protein
MPNPRQRRCQWYSFAACARPAQAAVPWRWPFNAAGTRHHEQPGQPPAALVCAVIQRRWARCTAGMMWATPLLASVHDGQSACRCCHCTVRPHAHSLLGLRLAVALQRCASGAAPHPLGGGSMPRPPAPPTRPTSWSSPAPTTGTCTCATAPASSPWCPTPQPTTDEQSSCPTLSRP